MAQVRFGHAATSGFARLLASGSSLGMGRGGLDTGPSPGISPALGGASTLEISRALGRSPGGLTPGRSGSLSALGARLSPGSLRSLGASVFRALGLRAGLQFRSRSACLAPPCAGAGAQ